MSLEDKLGEIFAPRAETKETPKVVPPKKVEIQKDATLPGSGATRKRTVVRRGEAFTTKGTLTKWSPR